MAGQSYRDIEHIVVDGGSTDGTVGLLGRHPELRWSSEPDQGQTDALIKGFGLARGQILTWLNADDSLESHSVDRVVERFRRPLELGWVYGKVRTVTDLTETIFAPRPSLDSTSFRFRNEIAQPGTFIASWAFERVGGLDRSFDLAMDVDLWLRLLDAGIPAGYIPEILATFEIHGGSKSGRLHGSEFAMEEFRAFAKSGRAEGAAICLGVAAAERSAAGHRTPCRRLGDEKRVTLAAGRAVFPPIPAWLVAAQARTMAATLDLRHTPLAVCHLAHPGPWRHPHTRAQAIAVSKGAVLRILRQLRKKA